MSLSMAMEDGPWMRISVKNISMMSLLLRFGVGVITCYSTGKGRLKWEYDSSSQTFVHTNNPYSLYGYYFVTDATPTNDMTSVAQASGASTRITTYDDYLLHEQELVSVNQSGREFLERTLVGHALVQFLPFLLSPGLRMRTVR